MVAADTPISQEVLDELWDFGDPGGWEERFATAATEAQVAGHRAELLTQQARALGLQGRYDDAISLLDRVSATTPAANVRVLLERGRVHNSAERPADAVPLFAAAAELAHPNGLDFLEIDALHMVAIADRA